MNDFVVRVIQFETLQSVTYVALTILTPMYPFRCAGNLFACGRRFWAWFPTFIYGKGLREPRGEDQMGGARMENKFLLLRWATSAWTAFQGLRSRFGPVRWMAGRLQREKPLAWLGRRRRRKRTCFQLGEKFPLMVADGNSHFRLLGYYVCIRNGQYWIYRCLCNGRSRAMSWKEAQQPKKLGLNSTPSYLFCNVHSTTWCEGGYLPQYEGS